MRISSTRVPVYASFGVPIWIFFEIFSGFGTLAQETSFPPKKKLILLARPQSNSGGGVIFVLSCPSRFQFRINTNDLTFTMNAIINHFVHNLSIDPSNNPSLLYITYHTLTLYLIVSN